MSRELQTVGARTDPDSSSIAPQHTRPRAGWALVRRAHVLACAVDCALWFLRTADAPDEACRTQPRNVSDVHPILTAIERIAAHGGTCSAWWPKTRQKGRSRVSGECRSGFCIASSGEGLRLPQNPGRFTFKRLFLCGRGSPARATRQPTPQPTRQATPPNRLPTETC